MESDSISSVSALSDAFLSMFIFFLILLLADQFLTLIRAAVVSANFSDDLVDSSKSDRKAMTSLFTATAANLAVLDFALSCANVLTAIAGVLLTFSGLAGTAVKLTPVVVCLIIPAALLLISGMTNGVGTRFANQLAPALLPAANLVVAVARPFHTFYHSFEPRPKTSQVTFDQIESNLIEWVENAPSPKKLKEEERKMVRSILGFSDTLIREIMIPRIDLTAIELNTDLAAAAETILASGHSRLPVYDDEIDNIVGILYAKDLIKYYSEEHAEPFSLKSMMREPVYVPESKKAGDLLADMQLDGIHMVIVVDEYGGTAGIVSMEDIVEEIVGEIRDEFDNAEEIPIEELGPDVYSFLGRVDITDVNETLGTHLSRESSDTIAGFMYTMIGKVPEGDEIVNVEDWRFTIAELTGNRIRRVRVERRSEDPESDMEEPNEQEATH